jgi:hypothetical protein
MRDTVAAFAAGLTGRKTMAKGQVRSNREAKKPKQAKKVASPAAGVSWATAPKTTATSAPAKKK